MLRNRHIGLFALFFCLGFFSLPHPAIAAILEFGGWETGTMSGNWEGVTIAGSPSIESSTVISGNYSLECHPTTSSTCAVEIRDNVATNAQPTNFIGSYGESVIGFKFRVHTFPATAGSSEPFFESQDNGGSSIEYRIDSDGTISLYHNATIGGVDTAWLATSTSALSPDTNYYVRIHVSTAGTLNQGFYRIEIAPLSTCVFSDYINNTTSGASLQNNIRHVGFGKWENNSSQTVDEFFDDWYIDTSSYNASNPSDCSAKVADFLPTGPGNMTGWTLGTGNTYTQVNQLPNDGDTTYIRTTSDATSTFSFSPSIAAGSTILGVAAKGFARGEGSSPNIAMSIVSGTATDTPGSFVANSSYNYMQNFAITDPNTSSPWTASAANSIFAGFGSFSAVAQRATAIYEEVFYVPATSSAPASKSSQFSFFGGLIRLFGGYLRIQ